MRGGESSALDVEMHKWYWSGIGKLSYLAKHSQPDISNAVHDLSKHLHAPNKGHGKAMEHCIWYMKYTGEFCLVLQTTGKWGDKNTSYVLRIRGRLDSNYAMSFKPEGDLIQTTQQTKKADEMSQALLNIWTMQ